MVHAPTISRRKVAAVMIGLAVCLVALFGFARGVSNQPDWAKTTTITFAGWTNEIARPQPVFLIQNSSEPV